MEHKISVLVGSAPAWIIQVDIPLLGPSPQKTTPETVTGTLLHLTESDLLKLATSQTEARFEGCSYDFKRLDKDGCFSLKRYS